MARIRCLGDIMYYNEEFKYVLFDIPAIVEQQKTILWQGDQGMTRFKESKGILRQNPLPNNLTWYFKEYNIFSLCAGQQGFYDIYKGLVEGIRYYFEVTKTPVPPQLWLQSWINSHKPKDILKTHNHDWPLHGYISVEPKDSETVFTDNPNGTELYRIKNKVGQVYFGPGWRFHHVEVLSPFEGERVTYGFDLEYRDRIIDNRGLFPVIL